MHFFRQYAAQSQIESLSDANGWGIHPNSHEYNILGTIAVGDKRTSKDILPDTVGIQETASVLEMRQAQFDQFFDQRLVRVGAALFEKDVMLYFRQLGAQYSLVKRYVEPESYEGLFHLKDGQSHSGYVELAVAMGDKRDAMEIFIEGVEELGESKNIEARLASFDNQRVERSWVTHGNHYHELMSLSQKELIARAKKRSIFTEDCGPEGFTVRDYIQRRI